MPKDPTPNSSFVSLFESGEKECCRFQAKCSGPACMAWRWKESDRRFNIDYPHARYGNRQGFCGLAGRPE